MSAALPADAELSLVRLFVDRPHMHGFHHFVLIERPGVRTVRLLHTVSLAQTALPRAGLGHGVVRKKIQPDALVAVLRRRRKDLVHHKARHAGGLADAVIARLEGQTSADPRQLDLEDLLPGRAA